MQLQELLNAYRESARSEREKGDYFERLVRVFLENDDTQKQYYSEVVPFADWAKAQGWSKTDTGIDLVATLADGSGYAAIQCKFYAPNHSIQKPDIDSFISAASNDLFTRLIIADTNVFGEGTRTPVAIYVFVKNPDALEHGRIHFHDIGDYLDQKEKLAIVRDFASIEGITSAKGWKRITPDENNDWLDQVDRSFDKFPILGAKRGEEEGLFENYSSGVKTQRDAWGYNASSNKLTMNMRRMIDFYNDEVDRLRSMDLPSIKKSADYDTKRISWSDALFAGIKRGQRERFENGELIASIYRPFEKSWLFYSKTFNERRYQMPRIFPNAAAENLVIQVSGIGASTGFAALMSNALPNLHTVDSGQCFPLYLYDETQPDDGLFAASGDQSGGLTRRDAITDEGLAHFQAAYPGQKISKEDLFYYIYGLLHSPDYRERFANNLAKQLPRIPAVKTFADFAAFRDAGRALGDLHVNFETVAPYMVTFKEGDHRLIPEAEATPAKFYRVKKMKFGGKGKEKDRTTVIYNENITMQNIPLEAYDYVVNGKPALEWVMERQVVKTDKASGIVNDANDYANETVGDPRYPLELFQRVITVSLETMKIVNSLPRLEID